MSSTARHSGARLLAWLIAAGVIVSGIASSAPVEALEVRVRAQSSLDASVTAAGTVVHISGSLRDELDLGLPQRRIDIGYRAQTDVEGPSFVSETLHTDRRGRFDTRRELWPGTWQIEVTFEETDHVTRSRIERRVELQPAPVDLRIQAPPHVVGTAASVQVHARASVGGVGLGAEAEVSVDGRSAGSIDLDQFGRGSLDVAASLRPGLNEVSVRIPGSEHREAVEEIKVVRLSDDLEVDATFEQVVERLQRGLAVEGVARDSLGPVEDLRVSVHLRREGGQQQTEDAGEESARGDSEADFQRFVTTDANGRFHAFFGGEHLEDGVWAAETTIVPAVGPEMLVSTEPVELDRRTSRWLLNALGLLGLLGAVALVLQRLWTVLAAYVQRRRHQRETRSRAEDAFSDTEQLVPVQLDEDQSIDAEPDRRRVSGLIWDVWKAQPLGGAKLEVSTEAGEPVRTETSAAGGGEMRRGGFLFDGLEPGDFLLEIDAEGFMPGQLQFSIPHGGTLSNVRLDLVAVPLKVRRLYQSLVETLEGEDLWGRLSPRQIEETLVRSVEEAAPPEDSIARREFVRALRSRLEHAPESMTAEGLAAMMTELVEETYFSGRLYDESVWRLARSIAVQLRERFEQEGT